MAQKKATPTMKDVSTKRAKAAQETTRKPTVLQRDLPAFSLEQALKVPKAIADDYGGKPTRPIDVAHALRMTPSSSHFRMLCGSAFAYGLTEEGWNAESISLSQLGRQIVAPTDENNDRLGLREAALKPRIIREFLEKYNESRYPREDIARNVLQSMGVPKEDLKRAADLIEKTAETVGFFKQIKDARYVDLNGARPAVGAGAPPSSGDPEENLTGVEARDSGSEAATSVREEPERPAQERETQRESNRKVFVTHGKNKSLVPQLKELLTFGQLEPLVSIERESTSKPVPDKVMDDMRLCGAAIIHVDADRELMNPDGEKEMVLNANVLIEIGAAMALYDRRFILLVQKGVRLPTNLQGLYAVSYEGDKLDGEATLRLLKAFNEFRSGSA